MKSKIAYLLVLVSFGLGVTTSALAQFGLGSDDGNVIAHFDLSRPMTETPQNIPPLFGNTPPVSLKDLLARLQQARKDTKVKAVVLEVQNATLGFAQIQEISAALKQFAAVNKPVYVHADTLTTGTYALATSASHLCVTPTGDVWLTGLYGEVPYLKGLLDRMGLMADFLHCGDYKTAAEPLTRTGPSEASREMTKWLLDDIYRGVVEMIAEGRDLKPAQVKILIDKGPYSAEEALEAGLIDAVEHRHDFIASLKKRFQDTEVVSNYGQEDEFQVGSSPWELINKLFAALKSSPTTHSQPSVAIVYVDGVIQMGKAQQSLFGTASGAFSTTIRRALEKAAEDDSVKAVVLRVDSPGGSALASEIILDAARRVAKKKPLIVSMGNVAGSGGYYVSCAADTIFASEGTITGSIGVVGGKIVTTGGWNKLGINWSSHHRGENALILSSSAPFTPGQREKMQSYMTTIYETFKQHVSDNRGDKLTKPVEEIAGGRVYTGAQAKELGLVDRMGGLTDAIHFAAEKAGLGDYKIRVIPEAPNIFQLMFGGAGQDEEYASTGMKPALFGSGSPLLEAILPLARSLDPRRADAVMMMLKRIELIHSENVIMMMPSDLIIR